ncbi:MAG: translocation/assembly module TamB domain-containing protein [Bacteroidales bacterium]|nr:translocation/assembly module TamB domain-containing protein [Bacteroidales bacterium]
MVFLIVVSGISVYLITHFNLAGKVTEEQLIERLCQKLTTQVTVDKVEITWLNQIALNELVIFDQQNDTLFHARRAMIGYELIPLMQQKLVLNTIQLIDFDVHIRQDSAGATPNFAFLVEALAPRLEDKQRHFINDASLHALFLRRGTVSYDILNKPHSERIGLPDPNHLLLQNVSASLSVEVSHISGLDLKLKRLSFTDHHGSTLESLQAHFESTGIGLHISDINMKVSHPLDESARGYISLSGESSIIGDSISVDLHDFTAEGNGWGNIGGHVLLFGRIQQPDSVHIIADFRPSYLGHKSIGWIRNRKKFLPGGVYPVLDQIGSINWKGTARMATVRNIAFDGEIGTEGALESDFNSHLVWNDGNYDGSRMNGNYKLDIPSCALSGSLNTTLNRSEIGLSFNTRVLRADPYRMHLTDIRYLRHLEFSGVAKGDLRIPAGLLKKRPFSRSKQYWKNIPTGFARIDSLCIKGANDTISLDPFRLNIVPESGSMVGVLQSPVLNLVATPTALIGSVHPMPRLAELLAFSGSFGQEATFSAEWDSIHHIIQAEVNAPEWIQNDVRTSLYLTAAGNTQAGVPVPDVLQTNMMLECQTPKHYMSTRLVFGLEWNPLTLIIEPSTVNIDNKEYSISEASVIQTHKDRFMLENLKIQELDQKLELSGQMNNKGQIDLLASLNNFQTDFFFDFWGKKYLDFGGKATGSIQVSSDSLLRLATRDLYFNRFSYMDDTLGDCRFSCDYNIGKKRITLDSDIFSDESHVSHTSGWVQMGVRDSVDLLFETDSLNIDFLKYWLGGVLQDMHGHTSGDIHLFGDCDSLNLLGTPKLHQVNFTYDLLGGRYSIDDTLYMTHGKNLSEGFISLNNAKIYDANGQQAFLSLDLNHNHLHNLEYGVDFDIPSTQEGFLVFDHPKQEYNEIYWGRLWATGRCQMHGTYSQHRISAQLSPAGKSVFNLSPGEESFSENSYNFLTFRDKRLVQSEMENDGQGTRQYSKQNTQVKKSASTFIEADLLIHANERCQVYVQMDPLAEDRLICRGKGDLSLHYDPYHDITLTGTYDISQGSYTVNMRGDLMTKAFQLQEGSSVTFSGLPSESNLNLNAVYSIPSANLRDLDESFASLSSLSRTSLPVDCKLKVTGFIRSPQIAFDLEVKNTSDDVQALVHNIIGTQEMLNREVFYLLLFSKFYTPEYASTSQKQTGSELTSFASSSLTSQLNNLLGHMSDNFTLGTNFRTDKGDFSDMEMDFSLSTRLLNDRLLLNGNLGYRDPANRIGVNNSNTSFIGDFDVEFLINTSGTVRAKAYSHYNERDYSINNALTTQGIGIILRKDFISVRDLLKRKH